MGKRNDYKSIELSEIKSEVIKLTCIVMLINLLFNYLFIINGGPYSLLRYFLITVTLIFTIMNLTLGMKDKNTLKCRYIWTTILLNIFTFTFYLMVAEFLNPTKNVVKIVIVLNYVLLEIYFIIKRIIIKNDEYIQQMKNEKQGRYIKQDALLAIVITVIVIFVAKLYDNSPIYTGRIGIMISEIIGPSFLSVGVVTHIHTFTRYMYNIKPKYKIKQ